MKKITIALLLLSTLAARSQENEAFYVFNADWKPTTSNTRTKTGITATELHVFTM